ncbi:MAG: sensor histidine kinase [Alkalispirochaeta sp.]
MAPSSDDHYVKSLASDALLQHGTVATIVIEDKTISYANPAAIRLASKIGLPKDLVGSSVEILGPEVVAAIDMTGTAGRSAPSTGKPVPGESQATPDPSPQGPPTPDRATPGPAPAFEIAIGREPHRAAVLLQVVAVPVSVAIPASVANPASTETSTDPANPVVLLISGIAGSRSPDTSLRERTAILEAVIESFPFDFWMNDLGNRTIMQNSVSRALWGEQTGNHMTAVQDDPAILDLWAASNREALAGHVQTTEITYIIDGEERVFHNIVGPVRDGDTVIGIFGANIDITPLKHALRDRDLLLRELNHRVKNHLQMILSVINLQAEPCPEFAGDTYRKIESRIQAVLLVHDQLYETADLHAIDLGVYTSQLVEAVRSGYGNPVDYTPFGEDLPIQYHHAVPYGIALSELILNAIIHGLPKAPITIVASEDHGTVTVTVDNRVDPVNGIRHQRPDDESGGLAIIASVIAQISGEISAMYSDDVYRASLRIPYPPFGVP